MCAVVLRGSFAPRWAIWCSEKGALCPDEQCLVYINQFSGSFLKQTARLFMISPSHLPEWDFLARIVKSSWQRCSSFWVSLVKLCGHGWSRFLGHSWQTLTSVWSSSQLPFITPGWRIDVGSPTHVFSAHAWSEDVRRASPGAPGGEAVTSVPICRHPGVSFLKQVVITA